MESSEQRSRKRCTAKSLRERQREKLLTSLKELLVKCESPVQWGEELEGDVPKNWEIFGDLLMLPAHESFTLDVWNHLGTVPNAILYIRHI